jgi:hypothetical protein
MITERAGFKVGKVLAAESDPDEPGRQRRDFHDLDDPRAAPTLVAGWCRGQSSIPHPRLWAKLSISMNLAAPPSYMWWPRPSHHQAVADCE